MKRRKEPKPRLFFATDVHGSETCFRKFVNAATAYKADAIILGGDITGKQLVLIVAENGGWRIGEGTGAERLESPEALEAAQKRLSSGGLYPIVIRPEEERALTADPAAIERRFTAERLARVRAWMELAEERLRPLGSRASSAPATTTTARSPR